MVISHVEQWPEPSTTIFMNTCPSRIPGCRKQIIRVQGEMLLPALHWKEEDLSERGVRKVLFRPIFMNGISNQIPGHRKQIFRLLAGLSERVSRFSEKDTWDWEKVLAISTTGGNIHLIHYLQV